jgi:hypothetical protein
MFKIYKLTNEKTDLVYYGITKQKYLCKRLGQHKEQKGETSKILFKDNDIVKITLIQYTKDKKREAFYIKNFKCINKLIPKRTQKEYYNDNKNVIQNNIKDYHIKNKDKIDKYQKENWKLKKDQYNKARRDKRNLLKTKK